MPHHYKRTPLFGGALEAELPDNFADVSKLRQVPDNQEVFIDKDGFTSIIFDITERVGGPGSSDEIDGKALTIHLEELVGTDADTVKVWNSTETQFSKLEYVLPLATEHPPPCCSPATDPRDLIFADTMAAFDVVPKYQLIPSSPRKPQSLTRPRTAATHQTLQPLSLPYCDSRRKAPTF